MGRAGQLLKDSVKLLQVKSAQSLEDASGEAHGSNQGADEDAMGEDSEGTTEKADATMNRSDLIDAISEKAELSKSAAARALAAATDSIKSALAHGEKVVLVGFGTFLTKQRAARTGRNPQTGAPLQIAAATVPVFRAGQLLKDSVKLLQVKSAQSLEDASGEAHGSNQGATRMPRTRILRAPRRPTQRRTRA